LGSLPAIKSSGVKTGIAGSMAMGWVWNRATPSRRQCDPVAIAT
jgi:hypothetical protein